jgi:hypothetical protein
MARQIKAPWAECHDCGKAFESAKEFSDHIGEKTGNCKPLSPDERMEHNARARG